MTKEPPLAYWEWSSPDGVDLDDVEAVRAANPAFGTRLNEDFIFGVERQAMDDEEFARERLGIFPDDDDAPQWSFVTEEAWEACRSKELTETPGWLTGAVALAVELSTDRSMATIAAAGDCREGGIGGDIVARGPGTSWVVPQLVALKSDPDHPVARVVIDPRSQAASLIDDITAAGIEVTECSTPALVKATGQLVDEITEGDFVHRGRPELDAAVGSAVLRKYGDSTLIDRWAAGDPTPLIVVDLARWGHLQIEEPPVVAGYYSASGR